MFAPHPVLAPGEVGVGGAMSLTGGCWWSTTPLVGCRPKGACGALAARALRDLDNPPVISKTFSEWSFIIAALALFSFTPALAGRHQHPLGQGVADQLGDRAAVQLAPYVGEVVADRAGVDIQLGGDPSVSAARRLFARSVARFCRKARRVER